MNRRGFLSAMAAAPLAALAGAAVLKAGTFAKQQAGQQTGQQPGQTGSTPIPGQQPPSQWPGQSPPNPLHDNFPGPKLDPKAILKEDQKDMVKDVNRLYELAGKLRKQVTKTDSSEVLSMDLIHTAEEIEKLAKHIKNLARG
jgi:hypothetical protein